MTLPAIARCTRKACGHVARIDAPTTPSERRYHGTVTHTLHLVNEFAAAHLAPCPTHGAETVTVKAILGTVTDHECDAKCLSAKGHVCECACGGMNHGTGH